MSDNKSDSANDTIYIVGFLIVLFIVISMVFGEEIAGFSLWTRLMWMKMLHPVLDFFGFEYANKMQTMMNFVQMYSPREIMESRPGAVMQVSKDLRWFIAPVFMIILLRYSYKIWERNPHRLFTRHMTAKQLVDSEVRIWPWIAPIKDLGLEKIPLDKGDYAMSPSALKFVKRYKLLDGRDLNKARAEKLFIAQLGSLWEGFDKLPSIEKALLACFSAHVARDTDTARDMMAVMAKTAAKGEPDTSFAEALFRKHENHPNVQKILKAHAYSVHILLGMLEESHKSGTFPPLYFLWLKPRNRGLWFALNAVDRRTPFMLNAGVHAHFLAEKVAGHKIEKPYVEKAVSALERTLREYVID